MWETLGKECLTEMFEEEGCEQSKRNIDLDQLVKSYLYVLFAPNGVMVALVTN